MVLQVLDIINQDHFDKFIINKNINIKLNFGSNSIRNNKLFNSKNNKDL